MFIVTYSKHIIRVPKYGFPFYVICILIGIGIQVFNLFYRMEDVFYQKAFCVIEIFGFFAILIIGWIMGKKDFLYNKYSQGKDEEEEAYLQEMR